MKTKKLIAEVTDKGDGNWSVVVTDTETKVVDTIPLSAETEKDAAFKAMEIVNDR